MSHYPPLADGKTLTVPCQILVPTKTLLEYSPIAMNQYFHWYYLDWLNVSVLWQGTVIAKRKNMPSPQNLRDRRTVVPRVNQGGWHFTTMGGVERVIKKMSSTVEGDLVVRGTKGTVIEETRIRNCIKNGIDIWNRTRPDLVTLKPYDISNINLPYLQEFVKKYPYFLREYDFGKDDV